jgi:prepilin-type N-terminal cleavage/methylation domain-containing protein
MKRGQKGFTIIELIVVMGFIGVMGAIAIPNINSRQLNLTSAVEELGANVRLARANATGRGVHYRVTFSANSYSVQRLRSVLDAYGNKIWVPDGSPQTEQLPNTVTVISGAGATVEFNSRGLLEDELDGTPADIVNLTLRDSSYSSRTIEIWPSGQIQEA